MYAESSLVPARAAARSGGRPGSPRRAALAALAPGLALAVGLALAAALLALAEQRILGQPILEGLVLALLLGVAVRNLTARPEHFRAGAGFAAGRLLELAVALLGIGVDARVVLAAGPLLLALIAAGVACGIAVSFGIGRALGLPTRLAILVAVGNSICGNSAIAAVAPVIGARKDEVASSIALTAVLGLAVILLLPFAIPLLGLSLYQYGVVAGMGVYAVPQVLAATLPVSQVSAEVGTLVKLVRVLLLGPVVVLFGLVFAGRGAAEGRRAWTSYLPWFVVAFAGLALVRSLGLIPAPLAATAHAASGLLTAVAMAGLGLGVELGAVRRVGPRVGLAVLLSLAFLIGVTTLAVLALGLGA